MKRFPSVKKNSEFRRIYQEGNSRACGVLVMFVSDNGLSFNRLGISAGKRIGNSVVRHTFCRRIREIFRLTPADVQGKDIIVTARSRAGSAQYRKLEADYLKLLRDHGLLKEN